ncbi:MAG TPA: UDP-N-acetylmuramoyl-L-alanine--D-glutamate ligase [Rhodoblastus sp.]|nr:UDP-N-acetylmuramoyl-L-alanine--D-glutamate ligase [Rhodoblastus sp.]
MIAATTFAGKRVALFGLGGSGLATAFALRAGGTAVAVWDDNLSAREKAAAEGFAPVDLAEADWSQFSSFVLSPGVPLTHPEPHWTVKKAQAAGVEIIGDIEIFCRERREHAPEALFVAITGTNGKSTTTALTAHLFRAFGKDVQMGGNIGTPILSLAPLSNERVYVIELSTFQIDLTPSLDPSVGVLLNLTPDHIDRHGTMENYAAIKERLVASADRAVISVDDHHVREIAERRFGAGRPTIPISVAHPAMADGLVARGTAIEIRSAHVSTPLVDLAGIASLRGAHNAQNALAAVAALGPLADDRASLQAALRSFPGLAHRMENVGKLGRVLFVNDSKATNADAAEKALLSFNDIFWIIGGKSKEGGVEPLRPLFDRIAKAYLIGAATDDFAHTLDGVVVYEKCGTLDVATRAAARDAARSDAQEPVVLLSPACASYDQFPNFEKRGDAFRAVVSDIVNAGG